VPVTAYLRGEERRPRPRPPISEESEEEIRAKSKSHAHPARGSSTILHIYRQTKTGWLNLEGEKRGGREYEGTLVNEFYVL
jgi:hypothetical protein